MNGSVSGGGTITGGATTIGVGGSWTLSSFVKGTSTVLFSGTGSIGAASFNNVTVAASGSMTLAASIAIGGALQVNGSLSEGASSLGVTGAITGTGSLSLSSGTLTAGAALSVASFAMGSGSANVAGNFGPTTFGAGTGSVIFDGASTLGASYSFYNLSIAGSSTLSTAGYSTTIAATFANQGTLYRQGGDYVSKTDAVEGTVVYQSASGTVQSYGGTADYYNLTINGNTFTFALAGAIAVNGSVTIAAGTLAAGGYSIQVAGSWANGVGAGGFSSSSGVSFINSSIVSVISGNTTFFTLGSATPGKTLQFTAGSTQTASNSFVITGTAANPIVLTSTTTAAWTIATPATTASTANVIYATISHSTSTNTQYALLSTNVLTATANSASWNFVGTTYTWVGGTVGNLTTWALGSNWSPSSGFPGAADSAIIPTGRTYYPATAGAVTVTDLTIQPSANLDILGNTLTISGASPTSGP